MKCLMPPAPKIFCAFAWVTIGFGLLLLCVEPAFSEAPDNGQITLQVGVTVAPPAYMKTADNRWEGLSVDLWQAVAQDLGIVFEFREFASFMDMLEALENKEIDIIPSVAVGERFVARMDFSQSYLKTGLAIAVPAERSDYTWIRIFESLLSKEGLKAIGALITMSLLAGVIVWLFERRRNSEEFGEGTVKGVAHGIWWAMVTMTTVGYGDKAPKTVGGRTVALIWMIFSVVFVAVFTATITSSLTVDQLSGKVRGFNDLFRTQVGAVRKSEALDFLNRQGISVVPFDRLEEGLLAVVDKRIDAMVGNEHLLRYLVRSEFPGRVHILPDIFDEYFVSIALQPGSPLRKPINKMLIRYMESQKWTELLNHYLN